MAVQGKRQGRPTSEVSVLVGTRKGAWRFRSDGKRRRWQVEGPLFLGHIVHHFVQDPREPRALLAAARTGHLGPTLFRSADGGRSWKEASRPPAFPKAAEGQKGRVVQHTFWLTPGHASERGTWYAGTSPQGLFRSEDAGDTWEPVPGLNEHPRFLAFMGGGQDGTPDGPMLHSVIVHPDQPRHLYVGMSSGGVHESLDGGATWTTLIEGMEVVAGFDVKNPGFHDPHCMRLCPSNPERLYQQNHCGIYRLDRPGTRWQRIGKAMPKRVGDIGFPLVVHPRDADTLWVLPMDGTDVWPRTCPDGKPAVYVSRNGGKAWRRLAEGFPAEQAWWTVKRQAMSGDALDPVGLYFGTTSGEVWTSRDEGETWSVLARHLPEIYSVETAVA